MERTADLIPLRVKDKGTSKSPIDAPVSINRYDFLAVCQGPKLTVEFGGKKLAVMPSAVNAAILSNLKGKTGGGLGVGLK